MASRKKTATAVPAEILSDKEFVLKIYPKASVEKLKNRFYICDKKNGKPIFSGLTQTEPDAWKRAASELK
jgi:hypothetical protein